uniref:Uncharacterized protein n=1 Tax=Medicago truncatula TaxID=3880 RepID=I3SX61_MEDTR|nr:unknown [Medicago truncatula]
MPQYSSNEGNETKIKFTVLYFFEPNTNLTYMSCLLKKKK